MAVASPARGRALVLDGASAAALETLQALGRAGVDVDISAQEQDCLAFRSRYARRRLRQPSPARPPEFVTWLRALDECQGYTLIVPATEGALSALRTVPGDDPVRRKAVLPPDAALDVALDKPRTLDLARRLGISVPESVRITSAGEWPEAGRFPVVLKPERTAVAIDGAVVFITAGLARNESERLDYLRAWVPHVPVLQQGWVPGHGVGIELLFAHGREAWHFAHERLHEVPLTGGGSTYRRSVRAPAALLEAARALLAALRWHGVAMVEFRVGPDGAFHLMEINPRLWGSVALAIDAGVNFPLGLWRLAAGEPLLPQPAYRDAYFTRSLPRDLEWLRANMKADRRDPLLLTRAPARAALEYLRPVLGRESWDHFDVRDLRVTGAMVAGAIAGHIRLAAAHLRRRARVRRLVAEHRRRYPRPGPAGPGIRRLLVLCHGNVCRSPFAEQVLRARLPDRTVESAGFHPVAGRASPGHLVRAARAQGIDLSGWRSARVTGEQVARTDLIVVMDPDMYERLAEEFPAARERTTLLGLFAPVPRVAIADPYRMTEAETGDVLEEIRAAAAGLARWLGTEGPGTDARQGAGKDWPALASAVMGAEGPCAESRA